MVRIRARPPWDLVRMSWPKALLHEKLNVYLGLANGKYGNKDHKAWNKLVETLEIISPLSSGPKYEQYGCYCFQKGLYSSHFTGRGTPVDAIDQACFKFHQCQRCLGIDNG